MGTSSTTLTAWWAMEVALLLPPRLRAEWLLSAQVTLSTPTLASVSQRLRKLRMRTESTESSRTLGSLAAVAAATRIAGRWLELNIDSDACHGGSKI